MNPLDNSLTLSFAVNSIDRHVHIEGDKNMLLMYQLLTLALIIDGSPLELDIEQLK